MEENLRKTGIVVIGRNEGDRLKTCLNSVLAKCGRVVYVDSGSTDDSVEYAASMGINVGELDISTPFCAARARNFGFQRLIGSYPEVDYVQFIDGDCELCDGWLSFAANYLTTDQACAVVAGRRRERFPERTVFNMICDIEWNTPVGKVKSSGGDFMIRKDAFLEVNGFNPTVVSAEEPELCYRLRQRDWSEGCRRRQGLGGEGRDLQRPGDPDGGSRH